MVGAKRGRERRGGEGEKSTKGKKSLSYSPLPFRRLPRGIIIFVHVADANPVITSANLGTFFFCLVEYQNFMLALKFWTLIGSLEL